MFVVSDTIVSRVTSPIVFPLVAGVLGVAGVGAVPVSLSRRGSLRMAAMMPGVVSVMVRQTVACFMSGR
jgi:hypothetical protein